MDSLVHAPSNLTARLAGWGGQRRRSPRSPTPATARTRPAQPAAGPPARPSILASMPPVPNELLETPEDRDAMAAYHLRWFAEHAAPRAPTPTPAFLGALPGPSTSQQPGAATPAGSSLTPYLIFATAAPLPPGLHGGGFMAQALGLPPQLQPSPSPRPTGSWPAPSTAAPPAQPSPDPGEVSSPPRGGHRGRGRRGGRGGRGSPSHLTPAGCQ